MWSKVKKSDHGISQYVYSTESEVQSANGPANLDMQIEPGFEGLQWMRP